MFERSEHLILKWSDEILKVSQISWESSPWKQSSLVISQILCFVLERWIRTQYQTLLGNDSWNDSKIHHNTELWTQLTENRWNSSEMFSQDPLHCGSSKKVQKFMSKMSYPDNSKKELSSCRCSMTSYGEIMTMTKECTTNSTLVPSFATRIPARHWSFLGPGWETKWSSTYKERLGGEWDRVAELMMIKFGESGHPVFPAASPLCRGTLESKRDEKNNLFTSVPMVIRLKLFFAQSFLRISSIISTELSQICAKNMVAVRQEQEDLLWQSNLIHISRQHIIGNDTYTFDWSPCIRHLWQKYKERVEELAQQDADTRFLKPFEIWKCFMTKHTDEFSQFAE